MSDWGSHQRCHQNQSAALNQGSPKQGQDTLGGKWPEYTYANLVKQLRWQKRIDGRLANFFVLLHWDVQAGDAPKSRSASFMLFISHNLSVLSPPSLLTLQRCLTFVCNKVKRKCINCIKQNDPSDLAIGWLFSLTWRWSQQNQRRGMPNEFQGRTKSFLRDPGFVCVILQGALQEEPCRAESSLDEGSIPDPSFLTSSSDYTWLRSDVVFHNNRHLFALITAKQMELAQNRPRLSPRLLNHLQMLQNSSSSPGMNYLHHLSKTFPQPRSALRGIQMTFPNAYFDKGDDGASLQSDRLPLSPLLLTTASSLFTDTLHPTCASDSVDDQHPLVHLTFISYLIKLYWIYKTHLHTDRCALFGLFSLHPGHRLRVPTPSLNWGQSSRPPWSCNLGDEAGGTMGAHCSSSPRLMAVIDSRNFSSPESNSGPPDASFSRT